MEGPPCPAEEVEKTEPWVYQQMYQTQSCSLKIYYPGTQLEEAQRERERERERERDYYASAHYHDLLMVELRLLNV